MGLSWWKIERKEVNRVRNGEGQGWHARQAHAEQNIGLIEKSALSIHGQSNSLFTPRSRSPPHVLTVRWYRSAFCTLLQVYMLVHVFNLKTNKQKKKSSLNFLDGSSSHTRLLLWPSCNWSMFLIALVEEPSTADAQVISIRTPCVKVPRLVFMQDILECHYTVSPQHTTCCWNRH